MNEGDIHITVTDAQRRSLERGGRAAAGDAARAPEVPRGQGRADRAGAPGGRHRRRGPQPGRDFRDDEAPRRVAHGPQQGAGDRRHAGRARAAARASIYNFSQPIKDRVEESISGIRGQVVVKIYGDDLNLMHEQAGRDRADPARHARLARRGDLPGRQRAAHRGRHRPRGDLALRRAGHRRRGTLASAYGGELATALWEGERTRRRAGEAPRRRRGRRRQRRRLEVPVRARRARAAGGAGQAARRSRAHPDQPRAGRAVPGHQVQPRGPRHRQLRRRGAGAGRRDGEAPRGLLPDLGRRVREPAPGDGPPGGHRAGLDRRDLRAALPGVRRRAARAGGAVGGPAGDGRRRVRALPDPHGAVGVGGRRLHHPVRRGGDGRRPAHHLHPPRARGDARRATRPTRMRFCTRCRSGCARC